MTESMHVPSPDTVGTMAWICVGLYLLGVIVWEWRKVSRTGRRERALTEEARRRQRERRLTEEARGE